MNNVQQLVQKHELNPENISDALHTMNEGDFDMLIMNIATILKAPTANNQVHINAIAVLCENQLTAIQPT